MDPHPPLTQLVRLVNFSPDGNSDKFRVSGWSENDRGVWSLSAGARLSIPSRPASTAHGHIIVFHCSPFRGNTGLRSRPIDIAVNGTALYSGQVSEEAVFGILVPGTPDKFIIDITCPVAAGATGGTPNLGFRFRAIWIFACQEAPAYASPIRRPPFPQADPEETERAVTRETGLRRDELFACFESLGHSCDYGIMQREAGIEPLGLFRWGAISTTCAFVGIMERFKDIALPDAIHAFVPEGKEEYFIREKKYNILYHTFAPAGTTAPEELIAKETKRLPFLRRKFLEEVQLGERIFILKRPAPIREGEALALWAALNLHAGNTLLYVSPHDDADPGAIDEIGPRLFRGYVDRDRSIGPSLQTWLSTCANAYIAAKRSHDSRRIAS